MHAEITAYRGRLVIALLTKRSIQGEVTTSEDSPRFPGQIIHDTAQYLGISNEALRLLRKLKPSGEDVGDLNWFMNDKGKSVFFWRGGRYAIFSPEYCIAAKDFGIRDYITIPNKVPRGAQEQLDAMPRVHKPRVGLLTRMAL
ncbi:hypothetical protein SAMN06265795_11339 [Noviherbaspirillum humi]|uniref:Uncharacterized protein n=1 Tax=Noviherbaspirillum humi TaxID=1688639 RepID=A0A239JNM4_9BURK|nr:hypothetical protein [Noviherbaspirillum humi]SNT07616.1 hypothetical protein SAMN06265795_11339 [Noviherbaspirillum humi]